MESSAGRRGERFFQKSYPRSFGLVLDTILAKPLVAPKRNPDPFLKIAPNDFGVIFSVYQSEYSSSFPSAGSPGSKANSWQIGSLVSCTNRAFTVSLISSPSSNLRILLGKEKSSMLP